MISKHKSFLMIGMFLQILFSPYRPVLLWLQPKLVLLELSSNNAARQQSHHLLLGTTVTGAAKDTSDDLSSVGGEIKLFALFSLVIDTKRTVKITTESDLTTARKSLVVNTTVLTRTTNLLLLKTRLACWGGGGGGGGQSINDQSRMQFLDS